MDENKELEELEKELDEDIEGFEDQNKFDDTVADIKGAFNDVLKDVNDTLAQFKSKLDEVDLSKEKLQAYFDELSKNIGSALNKAGDSVKQYTDKTAQSESWTKTRETANKVVDDVKTTAANAYSKAMENETVKTAVDKVSGTVKNATDTASSKYREFTHDPEVRKTVVGAVEGVKDVYSKVKEAVTAALTEAVEKEENTEEEHPTEE